MIDIRGAWTALVTPFRDGRVDEKALCELVEWQIASGIHGLVPCGTTGESVSLSADEHRRVIECVVQQTKGRVPVVAGAGTASTQRSIELAQAAKSAGADGLLLVCPYYNRPTQAGLEAHFRALLKAVPLPAILYNVPGRTGCDLSPETLQRLADLPQAVAIKEASGNVLRVQQLLRLFGDRYRILSGDDPNLLATLAVGGQGIVSVTSNLRPAEVARVIEYWWQGRHEESRALHYSLLPLHEALFVESNPGPIKAALALSKKIGEEIRLPLVWPSESTLQLLRSILEAEKENT